MGLTKKEEFSKEENEISSFAKAVGHPARVAILQHIITNGHTSCGELVDKLPLSQSTISQHLNELKTIGLIKGRVYSNSMTYTIQEKVWKEGKDKIIGLFDSFQTDPMYHNPDDINI